MTENGPCTFSSMIEALHYQMKNAARSSLYHFVMEHLNYAHLNNNSQGIASNDSALGVFVQENVLWKLLLLTAITYIVWGDQINIVLGPLNIAALEESSRAGLATAALLGPVDDEPRASRVRVALPPGEINHVTIAIDPAFVQRNAVKSAEAQNHLDKCREYVARFAPVAAAEMRKYGIPASVILAQGLLESDAGDSKLARQTNNHFGVKCFSKRCKRGHCFNFTDDSHKDFFVKYTNAWGSYRAHSQFLKSTPRYASLFKLEGTDYQGWARGLARAGYATDKRYGEKLIAMIQNLELHRYDRL